MNELLNNWSFVSVMIVLAMVVSMVTVQLYSILRRKEFEHRMDIERALHEKSQLLRERDQVETRMILQQLDLLDAELAKLGKDPELSERLETACRVLKLLRTTVTEEDPKP